VRGGCVAGERVGAEVNVQWDDAELNRMLGPQGIVGRDNFARTKRVEGGAKRGCPVDRGRLRASIQSTMPAQVGNLVVSYVDSDVSYAKWVHEGTGIYGPHKTPIVPVTSPVLVFQPKGAAGFVFAKSVRGMRGRPFLTDALPLAVT
jgi:hypothetical protein